MKSSICFHVVQYLLFVLLPFSISAQSLSNTTVAPPICNLNCPLNYTCFDNSSKNITKTWGYNGHICSSDLECFGERDPRGIINGPKQFPVTMQEGDTLKFNTHLNRFSFQPFNVTREIFDQCRPFTQGQEVIASESSSFIVPQKFLTAGVHYFIARSTNLLYHCELGLRAEIFVQSRQPCLNPDAPDMGVCSGKGLCASNGHFFKRNYYCLCCTGYEGQYCEELNSCSPTVNPCMNKANCTEITAGHEMKFKCTCVAGFTGQQCEINIDECISSPCQNGGFCTDKINGYECLCGPEVSGDNCEIVLANLCNPNPCLNGGTCRRSGDRRNYTCFCTKGFTGRNCTRNATSSSSVIFMSSLNILPSTSFQVPKTSSLVGVSSSDSMLLRHSSDFYLLNKSLSMATSTPALYQSSPFTSKLAVTTPAVMPERTSAASLPLSSFGTDIHSFSKSLFASMNSTSRSFATTVGTERTSSASYSSINATSVFHQEYDTTSALHQESSIYSVQQSDLSIFVNKTPVVSASEWLMSSTRSALSSQSISSATAVQYSSIQEAQTVIKSVRPSPTVLVETLSTMQAQKSSLGSSPSVSLFVQPSPITSLKASPVVSSTAAVVGVSVTISSIQLKPELTSVSRVSSTLVLATSKVVPTNPPPTPTTQPIYNLTCADNPCANNGSCITTTDTLLKFKCECPDGTWGPLCSKEFDLHFPRFSTNSYLVIHKPIAFTANGNKIVLTFSTKASDGLLFYSVHSKHRDFIQLRVVGGKLEFRFDPGDSLVVLESRVYVNTGRRVTAVVSYDTETRIGSLKVENNTAIIGKARGRLYGINLNGRLYVGGVPYELIIRPGVKAARSPGFEGCIQDIELNEVSIKANDSIQWYNIDECDTPACGRHPCQNGAVCQEDTSNPHVYTCECPAGFDGTNCEVHSACAGDPCGGGVCVQEKSNISYPMCLCPYGKAGRLCEENIAITVPSFTTLDNHASYLEYRRPEAGSESFGVMFQFRADNTVNGLIVYAGQNSYLGGGDDFFAVGVNNNKVVLQYNLGSGAVEIESKQNISSGWHVVTAGRQGKNGYLYMDGTVAKGQSPGELVGLNIFTPLYIGGVPSFSHLPNVILFKNGFRGSVYNVAVKLDGTTYPLSTNTASNIGGWNVIEGRNVKNESFDDCMKQPCQNNGTCVGMGATFKCNCTDGWEGLYCTGRQVPCIGYNPCSWGSTCRPHGVGVKCDCPLGQTGEFCKQDITLGPSVQFKDFSYMAFKPKPIKEITKITIRFKPTTKNGILFYVAWSLQSHSGDFLSITLHNGFVQFRYDLGSGVGKAQSAFPVSLNQWHVVSANRSARAGRLQLESENVISILSPSRAIGLDVKTNFYLGGVPRLSAVTPRAVENPNDLKDFTGCIDKFQVNGETFSLTRSGAIEGRNIAACSAADVHTFR